MPTPTTWDFQFRSHIEPRIIDDPEPTIDIPWPVLRRAGVTPITDPDEDTRVIQGQGGPTILGLSCQVGERCTITGPDGIWIGEIYDTTDDSAHVELN